MADLEVADLEHRKVLHDEAGKGVSDGLGDLGGRDAETLDRWYVDFVGVYGVDKRFEVAATE